jgi:coenzyme F420-reducing hydrogenase delta subunit
VSSETVDYKPRMLGIICNWCCYGGADLCGVSRFQYPPFIRLVRVMCSARVDLAHVFRAFAQGLDAVFIGGCHLNDCHYVTNGNYDALGMVQMCQRLLPHIGINPARLRLEWVSAGEGIRFANIMNEYGAQVQQLGPLGSSEGQDAAALQLGLAAATRLVPYIKLVQMERLRMPVRTEAAYHEFFASADFNRLFDELIVDQLALSRILLLLGEGAMSQGAIAARLGLTPATVARHVTQSARQGLVRYDVSRRSYALT